MLLSSNSNKDPRIMSYWPSLSNMFISGPITVARHIEHPLPLIGKGKSTTIAFTKSDRFFPKRKSRCF